jgi:hypothetical protein
VRNSCTAKDVVPSPRLKRVQRLVAFTTFAMFGLVLAVAVLGEGRTSRILLLEASKEIPKGRRAVVHVVDRRHVDDG